MTSKFLGKTPASALARTSSHMSKGFLSRLACSSLQIVLPAAVLGLWSERGGRAEREARDRSPGPERPGGEGGGAPTPAPPESRGPPRPPRHSRQRRRCQPPTQEPAC